MKISSLSRCLIESLRRAAAYNNNLMVGPEVVLWPDPEQQWEAVVPLVQAAMPELLVLGDYAPEKRRGPVIWIKTMVAGLLNQFSGTPVLYLPGISKQQLKRLGEAPLEMQPLLEYLYTGCFWQHRNGKEWTVAAFLQNEDEGLGLNLAQDTATKESLLPCLPALFENDQIQFPDHQLNSQFFRNLLLPNPVPSILGWMNSGDSFLRSFPAEKKTVFTAICEEQYGFRPEEANRLDAARLLGKQQNAWGPVWTYFANSPAKFPVLQQLLREAKPESTSAAQPEESWPQVNEAAEAMLRTQLAALPEGLPANMEAELKNLELEHGKRREWVWAELGQAPLATALKSLALMASGAIEAFPAGSLEEMSQAYRDRGYLVDQSMRRALAAVESNHDREVVIGVIRALYLPWLSTLADKFQRLVARGNDDFTGRVHYQPHDTFILFVDALRWELGMEFAERLERQGLKVELEASFCALPSLTPTAQPAVSPVADKVSGSSVFQDFRPQSLGGKDLTTAHFRELLSRNGYYYHEMGQPVSSGSKYWQAIGEIDTKGHAEGARMVKRVDELFEQVNESLQMVFEQGVRKVRIVTDHGWLLVPGGLPKTTLTKDHAETRWGRCALIKEGAKSDLLQLPWRWNPEIFIAYAPGVSFFKANEEYAHGGISLQECLVPTMVVHAPAELGIAGSIISVKWINLRCKVEVAGQPEGCMVDIRTKFSDPLSSIVLSSRQEVENGQCALMVDDLAEEQAVTIVLLDATGRILDKQNTTVGEN